MTDILIVKNEAIHFYTISTTLPQAKSDETSKPNELSLFSVFFLLFILLELLPSYPRSICKLNGTRCVTKGAFVWDIPE